LLKAQPAVKQLKDALVAAQIRTAKLLGSRSEQHPFVIDAREAEELLRDQLHDEVAVAIRGLEVDVELGVERESALVAKWNAARERVARLAESRAEYAKLVASVENHTRLVEAAQKNLADARARQAGAHSASIIGRIDGVEAGIYPVGPSRKTITAAGGIGGLILGFGFVFLFASAPGESIASVSSVAAESIRGRGARTNGKSRECTSGPALCGGTSNGQVQSPANSDVNLFTGMTLAEAIRSVEHRS
jgi:uncharacterized protein involved in exopolysaccharide biosynthesis